MKDLQNIKGYVDHIIESQETPDKAAMGRRLLTYLRSRALAQGRSVTWPPRKTDYVHLDVVRELLDRGADVNVRHREDGTTSLHWAALAYRAAEYDILRLVRFLIEAGADVNAKDRRGRTPLVYAVSKNGDIVYINTNYRVNWGGYDDVKRKVAKNIILAGADPRQAFSTFEGFEEFFDGDTSWVPSNLMPPEWRRQGKTRNLFGV
jgi:ankyrin repeat protein